MLRYLTVISSEGIYYSGAGIDPARAFGPDVVNHSFPGYHWIYWLGPAMESFLAAGLYHILELFHWKEVNPGQDYDEEALRCIRASRKPLHPGSDTSEEAAVTTAAPA